jgi:hypothetical protein
VRGGCLEYTWRAAPANAAGDDDGGGFSTQCGDGGDGGGGNNCSTTGSVTAQHYGVTLARMAGLPPAVTARALQVCSDDAACDVMHQRATCGRGPLYSF